MESVLSISAGRIHVALQTFMSFLKRTFLYTCSQKFDMRTKGVQVIYYCFIYFFQEDKRQVGAQQIYEKSRNLQKNRYYNTPFL